MLDEWSHEIDGDLDHTAGFDALEEYNDYADDLNDEYGTKWAAAVVFTNEGRGQCIYRALSEFRGNSKQTFIPRLFVFDAPDSHIMERLFSGSALYTLDTNRPVTSDRYIFGRDEYALTFILRLLREQNEYYDRVTVVTHAKPASLTALRLSTNVPRVVWCRTRKELSGIRDMYHLSCTVERLRSAMAPALYELGKRKITTLDFIQPLNKRISTLNGANWDNFNKTSCR
jgi:hypothetical protein